MMLINAKELKKKQTKKDKKRNKTIFAHCPIVFIQCYGAHKTQNWVQIHS